MTPPLRIILASQSPRRRQLLQAAGYPFDVVLPDPEVESACPPAATVEATVRQLARAKARAVAATLDCGTVLAADTLVECQGRQIGKPENRDDARRILELLQGQPHRVLTAMVLRDAANGNEVEHVEVSELRMKPLSEAQREQYLDSGAWQGKAGAFGYQDGWDWLVIESGSETNVVGLPVERLPELINRLHSMRPSAPPTAADAPPPPAMDRRSKEP